VRLIKIVDNSMSASAPSVTLQVPSQAQIGVSTHVSAGVAADSTPALSYHWEFGDGISADGPSVDHAYTQNGVYKIGLKVSGLNGMSASQTASITVQGNIRTTYDPDHATRYEEH
jgi:alpha-galactosidase